MSNVYGNQDVRQKYNELVQRALQNQNVKDPEKIFVKKMNKMDSIFEFTQQVFVSKI